MTDCLEAMRRLRRGMVYLWVIVGIVWRSNTGLVLVNYRHFAFSSSSIQAPFYCEKGDQSLRRRN